MRTDVSGFSHAGGSLTGKPLCSCETRNRAALAPPGVADVLAPTFAPQSEDRPPSNCAGITGPDPAHEHGEPTLGAAEDPGGAGEAWFQGLGQNHSQVYAPNPSSRAVLPLAVIPEAARIGRLGVRLLLCPDHNL